MPGKPDRIWTCPKCQCNIVKIIISGDERNENDKLCDVICTGCGDFYHPTDPFNRVPSEYFREIKREQV